LPSAVRDFAAIDARPRRTAECVEEREQAAYHPRVAFPQTRLRRLRRTPVLRDVVRETRLDAGDFVLPMFIETGLEGRAPISAMPGVDRLSISQAVAAAGEAGAAPARRRTGAAAVTRRPGGPRRRRSSGRGGTTGTTAAGAEGARPVTGTMIGGEVMTMIEVAAEVGTMMTETMVDI